MFILQKAWQVVWVHQVVQKVFGSDSVTPLYFPSPLSIIFGFLLDFLALHPLQPIRQKIKKPSFWKNKESKKERSRVSFCLLVYFSNPFLLSSLFILNLPFPVLGEDYSCYWSEIRKKNGLID